MIIRGIVYISIIEVLKEAHTFEALGIPYDVRRIDEDVDKISQKIYSSFKPYIYNSYCMILSPDYIMNYIVENTKMLLLVTISESKQRGLPQMDEK